MKSECEGGSKGSMGVARVGSGRDGQAGGSLTGTMLSGSRTSAAGPSMGAGGSMRSRPGSSAGYSGSS